MTRRGRIRPIAAAGAAASLLLALVGCAPDDPIKTAADRLAAIVQEEDPDTVSRVVLTGNGSGSVVFRKAGQWQDRAVDPAGNRTSQSRQPAPSRPEGLTIQQVAQQAGGLRSNCHGDDFAVTVQVVSPSATLAEISCTPGAPPVTNELNGSLLPVLAGGWDAPNLAVVWDEVRLVAGSEVVSAVILGEDAASVVLPAPGDAADGCVVTWNRDLGEPAGAWARCQDAVLPGTIDLAHFTAERVAAAIANAAGRLGATGDTPATAVLLNTADRLGVEVSVGARREFVSAADW